MENIRLKFNFFEIMYLINQMLINYNYFLFFFYIMGFLH